MNEMNEMNEGALKSLFKVSEIEITYRSAVPLDERIRVDSAASAHKVFRACWDENKIELLEEFKVLLLDQQCNCLGVSHLATGGIASCQIDPRLVFAMALKARASSVILAHNHPSSVDTPSEADIRLTNQMVQAGHLLYLPVLDHLILTRNRYYSFCQDGRMPGWRHSYIESLSPDF